MLVVGTGSLRRMAEIKFVRPDLDVQPIRGNVDTRLNKVRKGEFAGIVIAEAGLERMNLTNEIAERLPLDQFPSAAGQGALAIVAKEDNEDVIAFCRRLKIKQLALKLQLNEVWCLNLKVAAEYQ